MERFDKLALSTETLRDLTGDELAQVAGGGAATTGCAPATETPVCPSGATWFWDCQSVQVGCG
ncbi:MAG: hypothetical protein AVDCRST_MAG85-277 [uncultured Solirubrobacteraceae bacterium]|uniref:Uncharacterized protein n=1 Tax=uncultured Solirubrobacteraceae bacterium TaxID=1162706 RepID=A0A6J4RL60_9ACTN|nr:MAG: hypothetical protein AVDCRST_MAG85-277 [uncultured Solirubrobacteraceae bacterium]